MSNRENENNGNSILNAGNLQAKVWGMFQQRLVGWGSSLRQEIYNRRDNIWQKEEDSIKHANKIEGSESAEEAISDSFDSIQKKGIEIALRYLEIQQNPNKGTEELKQSVSELIVELHDPAKREALLLCVKDEYRDDLRDRLIEFSQLVWGLIDISQGNKTDNMWFVLSVVASYEGEDITEVISKIDGVSTEEIPDWAK